MSDGRIDPDTADLLSARHPMTAPKADSGARKKCPADEPEGRVHPLNALAIGPRVTLGQKPSGVH